MRTAILALFFVLVIQVLANNIVQAQWAIEDSHTTASLRGIHSVGRGVAWASGTMGTVLRTTDDGRSWQTCTVPPNAESLDFRGIQAFDANTALVMSSGKGELSRIYKTTDGCRSWKLMFTNPDAPADGFFDALLFITPKLGLVLGDPAHGSARNPVEGGYFTFRIRVTHDGGATWAPVSDPEADHPQPGVNMMPLQDESFFAASNSAVTMRDGLLWIGTSRGRILKKEVFRDSGQQTYAFQATHCAGAMDPISHSCGIPWTDWHNVNTPLSSSDGTTASGNAPSGDASSSDTSGIFSLAFRTSQIGIAVGGDYRKPGEFAKTAVYTTDGGNQWLAATTPPHGYRSSVAFDQATKAWIAVGPNGTDISSDDGRTWQPLKPLSSEPQDADQNWNAISLPFVVGPNGRIGKLNAGRLKH